MRNRTEEINVRVYKTEKNTIRRKAKKCGMNMSEYLRSLGTGAAVREAPRRELMLAYQKLTTLHDTVKLLRESMDTVELPPPPTPISVNKGLDVASNPRTYTVERARPKPKVGSLVSVQLTTV